MSYNFIRKWSTVVLMSLTYDQNGSSSRVHASLANIPTWLVKDGLDFITDKFAPCERDGDRERESKRENSRSVPARKSPL